MKFRLELDLNREGLSGPSRVDAIADVLRDVAESLQVLGALEPGERMPAWTPDSEAVGWWVVLRVAGVPE